LNCSVLKPGCEVVLRLSRGESSEPVGGAVEGVVASTLGRAPHFLDGYVDDGVIVSEVSSTHDGPFGAAGGFELSLQPVREAGKLALEGSFPAVGAAGDVATGRGEDVAAVAAGVDSRAEEAGGGAVAGLAFDGEVEVLSAGAGPDDRHAGEVGGWDEGGEASGAVR
jgi:hypothetical protein